MIEPWLFWVLYYEILNPENLPSWLLKTLAIYLLEISYTCFTYNVQSFNFNGRNTSTPFCQKQSFLYFFFKIVLSIFAYFSIWGLKTLLFFSSPPRYVILLWLINFQGYLRIFSFLLYYFLPKLSVLFHCSGLHSCLQ